MDRENYWKNLGSQPIRRRSLLQRGGVVGAGLAGAVLIGCGDSDDDGGSDSTPTAGTGGGTGSSGSTPKRGGTFKIAGQLTGDVPSLDYPRTNGSAMGSIANNASGKLVQWDERPESDAPVEDVLPDLATDWESSDGLEWIFRLRENAKNPAGRVFNAEDVLWSFQRNAAMRAGGGLLERNLPDLYIDKEPQAEVIDDFTLKITLAAPDADFVGLMGSHWWEVQAKEIVTRDGTDLGETGFGDVIDIEQLSGFGPYYVTEYVPASGFKLKRNPNYWDESIAYVDDIEAPLIIDPTAATAALQAGQLDAFGPMIQMPVNQGLEMEKVDDLDVVWSPAMNWNPWIFDMTVPPFNDVRVRRALALAVDRKAWVEELYSGRGRDALLVLPWLEWWNLPPQEMGEDGKYYTTYDPAEARKLLAAAGAEGATYHVQAANVGSYIVTYPNIDLMASFADAIGLKQELDIVDYATHIGGASFPEGGIYQSWIVRPDIQSYVYSQVRKESTPGGKKTYQAAWDNEPEFRAANELMEKQRLVLDSEERREMVYDLQKTWAKHVWTWYWPVADAPIVSNKNTHNFSPTPGWNAGIWKYVWKD